jgi:hypothetical protein
MLFSIEFSSSCQMRFAGTRSTRRAATAAQATLDMLHCLVVFIYVNVYGKSNRSGYVKKYMPRLADGCWRSIFRTTCRLYRQNVSGNQPTLKNTNGIIQ